MLELPQIFLIFKMRASRSKICNLYVKFDAKWKKGDNWVPTEEKRGSLGVRSA